MRKFLGKVAVASIFAAAIFMVVSGCSSSSSGGDDEVTIKSITAEGAKSEFTEGDDFSWDGLVVKKQMSDGEDKTVLAKDLDVKIVAKLEVEDPSETPFDENGKLKVGKYQVKVTLISNPNFFKTYEIVVKAAVVEDPESETPPADSNDPGSNQNPTQDDPTTEPEEDNPTTDPELDPVPPVDKPQEPTVKNIAVSGGNVSFVAGDTLDVGTLSVKKVMSDNTEVNLESADYTVAVTNAGGTAVTEGAMLHEGTYTVTVTLNADTTKTATYTITVGKAVLKGIAVTTEPDNGGKYVGDALNKVGLEITATYSDNSTKELDATSEGVTVSPETLSSTSNEITVTYNDGTTTKTTTFSVSATAVVIDSIEITKAPKTSYMGTDKTITIDGMEVTATYNNGATEKLGADKYTTNVDSLSFGATDETKELVVTLKSDTTKTDSVTLYYSAETLTLTSIAIKSNPTKATYFVGDNFEVDGLVITATYTKSGGTTTTRDITPTLSDVSVDMTTAGTKTATVTYEGQTATFNVTVTAIELSSIEIKTEPTKKNYIVGEAVDLTGLVVNAVYNDTRKNKTLGASDVTATPATLAIAGENVDVTVYYDGKDATYKVNVAEKPTFTVTVVGDKDIAISQSGTTLTANINGIAGTPTYEWIVDGENVGTSASYTYPALKSGEVKIITLIATVGGNSYSKTITIK